MFSRDTLTNDHGGMEACNRVDTKQDNSQGGVAAK